MLQQIIIKQHLHSLSQRLPKIDICYHDLNNIDTAKFPLYSLYFFNSCIKSYFKGIWYFCKPKFWNVARVVEEARLESTMKILIVSKLAQICPILGDFLNTNVAYSPEIQIINMLIIINIIFQNPFLHAVLC